MRIFTRTVHEAAGRGWRILVLGLVASVLTTACATQDEMDPPISQLTRAEVAIENAVEAGARQDAPVELQNARREFSRAQQANGEEEYEMALRHAEKAEALANLAESKTRAAEAQDTLAELRQGLETLEQEIGGDRS